MSPLRLESLAVLCDYAEHISVIVYTKLGSDGRVMTKRCRSALFYDLSLFLSLSLCSTPSAAINISMTAFFLARCHFLLLFQPGIYIIINIIQQINITIKRAPKRSTPRYYNAQWFDSSERQPQHREDGELHAESTIFIGVILS